MKRTIKYLTGSLIVTLFSSCQTMPSENDHVIPPVYKVEPKAAAAVEPMIVS